jgi:hypothetical protein
MHIVDQATVSGHPVCRVLVGGFVPGPLKECDVIFGMSPRQRFQFTAFQQFLTSIGSGGVEAFVAADRFKELEGDKHRDADAGEDLRRRC